MGCDIHAYSETRRNGKWEADHGHLASKDEEGYIDLPSVGNGRVYWLFTTLAGVRGEEDWSFGERGFPDDASDPVQALYEQWDSDAHTPSYRTMAELKAKCAELMLISTTTAQGHLESLNSFLSTITPTTDVLEDQRVVFWFDN